MGMGGAIEPINMALIIEFITDYFKDFSLPEIAMAFDMAAAGLLDLKPDDIKTYNSFSVEYIGKILASFRRYRTITIKENPEKEPEKELTKEESLKIAEAGMKKRVLERFELLKKGAVLKRLAGGNDIYDYFVRIKVLDLTAEVRTANFEKAKPLMIDEINLAANNDIEASNKKEQYKKDLLNKKSNNYTHTVSLAKSISVEDYLNDCVEMEIDLNEILK